MKRTLFLLLVVLIIIPCCGCGPAAEPFDLHGFGSSEEDPAGDAAGDAAVQAQFDEFLYQQLEALATEDSISLHYSLRYPENFGIERIEPTLGAYGAEEYARVEAQSRKDLETLRSFRYEELGEEQQFIYRIMEYSLELDTWFFSNELQYYKTMFNPETGFHTDLPVLLAEYKFYGENDVAEYLALLSDVDRIFSDGVAFERIKSEKGLFMPDFAVDRIVESCKDFTSHRENNLLLETFDTKVDELNLSEEQSAAYKEKNKSLVLNEVIPAYDNLAAGLKELKGTGVNDGGLSHFEKGQQYYEYLMKAYTGSSYSIDEIAQKIDERLDVLAGGIGYIAQNNDSVWDYVEDPDFGSDDPVEILEILKSDLTYFYPENTATSYTVKKIHPSLESSFSAAFYLRTPIDDVSSAVIYINDSKIRSDSLYTTMAHEGYPGHLYQDTYFNSSDAHPFRKMIATMGYIEGWATYAELNTYYLTQFDNIPDDAATLLGFNSEFDLAIRARCDIGVNYEGWGLDEIREYMGRFGIDNYNARKFFYDYAIKDPAKILWYYFGYYELDRLGDLAYEELGDAFSLKNFNECVLSAGPVPFSILRGVVEDFIAAGGQRQEAA